MMDSGKPDRIHTQKVTGKPDRIHTKKVPCKPDRIRTEKVTWLTEGQIKEKLDGDIDKAELVKSLSAQEPPVFDPMTGQELYKFPPKAQRVDIKKK